MEVSRLLAVMQRIEHNYIKWSHNTGKMAALETGFYCYISDSSPLTAFVAGCAAVLKGKGQVDRPNMTVTAELLKALIVQGVEDISDDTCHLVAVGFGSS
jgi:hypothetical protein